MLRKASKSLLEQMMISEAEIDLRLKLVDLDMDSCELLVEALPIIKSNVDSIVKTFYKQQLAVDEIAILIGDADTFNRLRHEMRTYILDLFSGEYNSNYVNHRLRIGMVHKRIGVEPKLYLSAINTLKILLFKILNDTIADPLRREQTQTALDRLFYFDTTLVFDTYISSLISEIEMEHRKTERYAQSLEKKVAERTSQLEKLARTDALTGLYNQRYLREHAQQIIPSLRRHRSKVSVIYFDVDDFKVINDTYGHLRGDDTLKTIGTILKNHVRESDIACRYGGDEFCVLLPDCDSQGAQVISQKLVSSFNEQCPDFSLSIGISESGDDHEYDLDGLIFDADRKMYSAKKQDDSAIVS